jgi:hypothetical protein
MRGEAARASVRVPILQAAFHHALCKVYPITRSLFRLHLEAYPAGYLRCPHGRRGSGGDTAPGDSRSSQEAV